MPKDRYLMAQVSVLNAIDALQKVRVELDTKLDLGAVNHLRYAMHQIADAMEEVFRKNMR